MSHARHKEDVMDIVDKVNPNDPPYMKLKASSSHKGPYEFDQLQHIQDLSGEHMGPIWCMKFSTCGRLLATAGQDRILRVWVLRSAYAYFQVFKIFTFFFYEWIICCCLKNIIVHFLF